MRRESEKQRVPLLAPGPPPPLTPLSPPPPSFLPSAPRPRPQAGVQGRGGKESGCSRREVCLRWSWGARPPHRALQPGPRLPRSPAAPAGWQAGRPPAPSRSLLRARPRLLGRLGQSELGSCPSPPAPPNQHALSSVDPLALRLTPLAPPPLISLLQSPEALGSVPPAFSNPGSAPKLGPWRPPPGRAFVIVGTSAQADPTEAGACSGQ